MEPFKKVKQFVYLADNIFHTEILNEMVSSSKYGLFNNLENISEEFSLENLSAKKICCGVDDCVKFLKEKAVSVVIVDENLEIVEWLVENYKNFGCALRFVPDTFMASLEIKFSKLMGGIMGVLQINLDL